MSNEELERQLFLKQLQINRLLDITQAINNNVKEDGLFEMYKSFLNWELGVRKMALFVRKEGNWACVTSIGIDEKLLHHNIEPLIPSFGNAIKKLKGFKHPFANLFDMVIPVFHKEEPIAYAFVGDYEGGDFGKIQLMTTTTNIVSVAIENKRLFRQQLEQARFNHEMKLASEMQRSLIPTSLPKESCFEVAAVYQPHFGVGGDYYDFFQYREGRYLLVVADVAGKGLAAALLMANFQANLHAIIRRTSSPEHFIKQLNKAVVRITKSERYLTLFVCDIDIETCRLRYINAGHIPPLLVTEDKVQYLTKGCTILGHFHSLPSVEVGELYVEGDALLCVFTDGITDVKNPEGSYFNEKILGEFAISNSALSAKGFNEKLMGKIEKFKGDEDFPDDITVLTCKFLKSQMLKKPVFEVSGAENK